jgi:hypothetical protein
MKFIKVNDETHKKLKDFCKGKKFFMQEWVEYVVETNIKNNLINMYEKFIENLEDIITVKKVEDINYNLMYIDYRYDDKPKPKPKEKLETFSFKLTGDNINALRKYLETVGEYSYFNTPGKRNVEDIKKEPQNKEGVIQYLTRSRIDGSPIFKAYRCNPEKIDKFQTSFNQSLNTFAENEDIASVFSKLPGTPLEIGGLKNPSVELIRTLEDHLVSVQNEDNTIFEEDLPEGIMAPKVTTKKGKIPLRDDENLDEVLELDFLKKIDELAEISFQKDKGMSSSLYFDVAGDLDFDTVHIPSMERDMMISRRFITKIKNASNFIAVNGRIGPAKYVVIPTKYMYLLEGNQLSTHNIEDEEDKFKHLKKEGMLAGMVVYSSDKIDDVIVYRNNNIDQPGVVAMYNKDCGLNELNFEFVEIGFFPHLQFIKIKMKNSINLISPSKQIEDTFNGFSFINLNNEALPYDLQDIEVSSTIKEKEKQDISELGIDIDNQMFSVLSNELMMSVMKDCLVSLFNLPNKTIEYSYDVQTQMVKNTKEHQQNIYELIKGDNFVITNGAMASMLGDLSGYSMMDPMTVNMSGLLYPMGKVGNATIFVDPYMQYNDNRILVFDNAVTLDFNKLILTDIKESDEKLTICGAYKIQIPDDISIKLINIKDTEYTLM